MARPLVKCQQIAALRENNTKLLRLIVIKVSGSALNSNHQDCLRARGVVLCAQATKINTLHLLGKEKILQKGDASHGFFFIALQIKRKQIVINIIKDTEGKETTNANDMAMAMLSHLSQIIGR